MEVLEDEAKPDHFLALSTKKEETRGHYTAKLHKAT